MIQECSSCGYTACSIEEKNPRVNDVLSSREYEEIARIERRNTRYTLKAALFSLAAKDNKTAGMYYHCLLYTSPSPRDS